VNPETSPAARSLIDVSELDWSDVEAIHDQASRYLDEADGPPAQVLLGRRVALLFAEPSTRTRS